MENEHKPPTTLDEAIIMVTALNPFYQQDYSVEEKELAFNRLIEFFKLLLPDK